MNLIRANKDNVKYANELLTKLIHDEKKYDNNINEECIIDSYYESVIDKDNHYLYFAMEDNQIVGYIYGFMQDYGNVYINKVAQLDAIFVEENYRNKGIAKALINSFRDWANNKGIKHIELKVCNGNKDAINLYHRSGFKDTKTIMILD